MKHIEKISQGIGIPYSALITMMLATMLMSFPIGAYVVFNSDIDGQITFEYPLNEIPPFNSEIGNYIPFQISLGNVFIVLWCVFLILFTISLIGPKKDFMNYVHSIINNTTNVSQNNYLISTIQWFSILIVISAAINLIQEAFGISIDPPASGTELTRFFGVTFAPIIEEIGFRVVLIGLPLFLLYSHESSFTKFVKSLWHPKENLAIQKTTIPLILIVLVGIFFGATHVLLEESWSVGKFTQATAGGVILGWVYFRFGLIPAILIHWATNYFIFSYLYMIADINLTSIQDAIIHPLMNSLEILFVVTGIISIIIMWLNYEKSKNIKTLKV